METKKVLSLIFSIIFVCAFGFVLSWGIINFNKVKDGMSGTELYTKEDLDNAYNDGYDTALKDKEEYTELINGYRDTITTLNDDISQLNSQINILTNNNKNYANQVTNLENQKSNLQEQVNNLMTIKSNNEETITQLNTQITNLQNEVAMLKKENDNKDTSIEQKNSQIARLNSQVANLQTLVTQLQTTNDLNLKTIDTLNNQIQSLNSQISELQTKISDSDNSTTELNNKIASLEKSIEYYEQYISNLESETQVVATFEFDGSVYNIQILNKGAYASVVTPTSTDYVIFNYWTVEGEKVDLSNYPIQSNTKFVANTTYKYDVKFMVDDTEYNNQVVTKDSYATIPTNPTKDGYEFDGWTLNGVDIISDINTTAVTGNTAYTAVFTKLHTVTFVYENETKATQSVRNGNYANNVAVENTTYKIFNGWLLNGASVNISTYKIVADTVFVADITYKYDVKFMVDDIEYNSQIITANNYATTPTNPTKDGYEFSGWSLNGVDIVSDIETIQVTCDTIYVAVFIEVSNGVHEKKWNNLTSFDGRYVWTDGTNYYYSGGSQQYVLDIKTSTWKEKVWNGFTSFYGNYIWTDGTNYYYSSGSQQYVLNKETSTWTEKTWSGRDSFSGNCIWTDGTNIYYLASSSNGVYRLVLNKETSTWSDFIFTSNGEVLPSSAVDIWTDGNEVYLNYSSSGSYVYCYVWNSETQKFVHNAEKWSGLTNFKGRNVWTDGTNYYYSSGSQQYVLNKETSTWEVKTWDSFKSFYGQYVWTDGINYYYSDGSTQYKIYP